MALVAREKHAPDSLYDAIRENVLEAATCDPMSVSLLHAEYAAFLPSKQDDAIVDSCLGAVRRLLEEEGIWCMEYGSLGLVTWRCSVQDALARCRFFLREQLAWPTVLLGDPYSVGCEFEFSDASQRPTDPATRGQRVMSRPTDPPSKPNDRINWRPLNDEMSHWEPTTSVRLVDGEVLHPGRLSIRKVQTGRWIWSVRRRRERPTDHYQTTLERAMSDVDHVLLWLPYCAKYRRENP